MLNIVVLQGDPQVARELQRSLQTHFTLIVAARNVTELRDAIPKYRAQAVILDVEAASTCVVPPVRVRFSGRVEDELADRRRGFARLSLERVRR